MVTLSIRKRGTPAGSFMVRLPRVRRERPGRRAAEQRDVQNRGRHAINVITVLTRPSVGYAKFFGRISIGRVPERKSFGERRAMDPPVGQGRRASDPWSYPRS